MKSKLLNNENEYVVLKHCYDPRAITVYSNNIDGV